jgi:hypothetical protein
MCYSYSNLESVINNCSYDLLVINKSIYQSQPRLLSLVHLTVLSSCLRLFPSGFRNKTLKASVFTHAYYIFLYLTILIIENSTTQEIPHNAVFFPPSCYALPRSSKYSPQHFVLFLPCGPLAYVFLVSY